MRGGTQDLNTHMRLSGEMETPGEQLAQMNHNDTTGEVSFLMCGSVMGLPWSYSHTQFF